MRNIKLRHIRVVEEIYKSKSIKKAAENLNLTPAAVSKACIDFETSLNVKLFHRTQLGMIPTEVCDSVIASGRYIRCEIESMVDNISKYKIIPQKVISIGYQENPLQDKLFEAVSEVSKLANRDIKLIREGRETLLMGLESKDFDFALMNFYQYKAKSSFRFYPIYNYNCVVLTKDGPLSMTDVIDCWDTYREATWGLPIRGFAIRDRFDAVLRSRDLLPPRRIIEYNTRRCIEKLFFQLGLSIILPQYAFEEASKYFNFDRKFEYLHEMTMESGVVTHASTITDPIVKEIIIKIQNKD